MYYRIITLVIALMLAIGLSGCGKQAQVTPSVSPSPSPAKSASPTPNPDLWSDTLVFGVVLDITDTTLSAMVADELRVYKLTDFSKKCIKDLNIAIGDETAIQFETDSEGNYTAKSLEKVNN